MLRKPGHIAARTGDETIQRHGGRIKQLPHDLPPVSKASFVNYTRRQRFPCAQNDLHEIDCIPFASTSWPS
jgi:hypothetical protein